MLCKAARQAKSQKMSKHVGKTLNKLDREMWTKCARHLYYTSIRFHTPIQPNSSRMASSNCCFSSLSSFATGNLEMEVVWAWFSCTTRLLFHVQIVGYRIFLYRYILFILIHLILQCSRNVTTAKTREKQIWRRAQQRPDFVRADQATIFISLAVLVMLLSKHKSLKPGNWNSAISCCFSILNFSSIKLQHQVATFHKSNMLAFRQGHEPQSTIFNYFKSVILYTLVKTCQNYTVVECF